MQREHYHSASLPVRVPRGFEGFWEIMLRLNAAQGCFTVADVDGESNVSVKCISKYLTALVRAGFAEPVSTRSPKIPGKYPTPLYRLLKMPREAPRLRRDGSIVTGTAQQNLWIVIRRGSPFTIRDLTFFAATDEIPQKLATVARFVRFLEAAGYLVAVKPSKGRHAKVWRLKPGMNTGPLPPSLKEINGKTVWDPNLKKFMGSSPVAKEVMS
ncbi:hypothetical protein [Bradyrhizobium sp. BR 10289]|uniref:hypothetical protein n=1 Tax=Bradyrhizobium sp. BR 10289 TaxID=2749993 RepID=UPI001C652199|nr:hypothetical protein [Bradyrhizobium sp. BR 10289]MBW7968147.1 hypothetical protein [Bradyrhizobium sp. BR 10289]